MLAAIEWLTAAPPERFEPYALQWIAVTGDGVARTDERPLAGTDLNALMRRVVRSDRQLEDVLFTFVDAVVPQPPA